MFHIKSTWKMDLSIDGLVYQSLTMVVLVLLRIFVDTALKESIGNRVQDGVKNGKNVDI